VLKLTLAILAAYFIGSIPWGLILSKRIARVDIRLYGSGRTGGTNVLRTLGFRAFLLVAILDLAKGAASVILATFVTGWGLLDTGGFQAGTPCIQSAAGLAAIIGHIWPVYARFKGGRGVATFFGALIAMCPLAGLFGGALLIITALLTGYASLGSITGTIASCLLLVPLSLALDYPSEYLYICHNRHFIDNLHTPG
jgi:glycerol-3-phosphate acyltransferase PlsY